MPRGKATTEDGRTYRHGTVSGWKNHGCRCADCGTAWAAYLERQKIKSAARRHGKQDRNYNGREPRKISEERARGCRCGAERIGRPGGDCLKCGREIAA